MTERELGIRNLLVEHRLVTPREKLSVEVSEQQSDVRRRSDGRTRQFFVQKHGEPFCVVKCVPAGWPFPAATITETLRAFSTLRTIRVPRQLAAFETSEGWYFVEEFLRGAHSLETLIRDGSVSAGDAAVLLRGLFEELHHQGSAPTEQQIAVEKRSIFSALKKFVREGAFGETLLSHVDAVIAAHSSAYRVVLTSGDIIDRNLLYCDGAWHLVDFEYSHRTVFGFKDAYRNILYSSWAKYFSLNDLYPMPDAFPVDVAAMVSLAWDYRLQETVLDDEALGVTQKHLRYMFWSAVEPSALYALDRRVGDVEQLLAQRDAELLQARREASESVQSLEASLLEKEKEFDVLRVQQAELARQLEASEQTVREQSELLKARDLEARRIIDELRGDVESLRGELMQVRSIMDGQAEELTRRKVRIGELMSWSEDLQHQARLQTDKATAASVRAEETARKLVAAEEQLALKSHEYHQQVAQYIYIKSTLSYSLGRILTLPFVLLFEAFLFIYRAIDRSAGRYLWPQGSKRYLLVNALVNIRQTIATGTYLLRMHGISGLADGIRRTWESGVSLGIYRNLDTPPLATPLAPSGTVKLLELREEAVEAGTGVSIVIPTLNESTNLLKLLPTLISQRGFTNIEIIVVDSGSTDDTIDLAEEYGATVVTIPPAEFSHSGARNLGAAQAKEDYLLMLTADALPPGPFWLYHMFDALRTYDVAAVSCREIPRCDVDLFSRVQQWNHYRFYLRLGEEDKVLAAPASNDPDTLRRHAQLSDVACLMARTTYEKYKFRFEYGEDLDLGLRLILDGHKIGLLGRTAIIHSHTRPPYYHLKRGFMDKLMISRILGEAVAPPPGSFDTILADILDGYATLASVRVPALLGERSSMTVDQLRERYERHLRGKDGVPKSPGAAVAASPFTDIQFTTFLQRCQKILRKEPGVRGENVVLASMRHFDDLTFRYMGETYELLDDAIVGDFVGSSMKSFANLCGVFLALSVAGAGEGDPRLAEISSELGDGKILWDAKASPR